VSICFIIIKNADKFSQRAQLWKMAIIVFMNQQTKYGNATVKSARHGVQFAYNSVGNSITL